MIFQVRNKISGHKNVFKIKMHMFALILIKIKLKLWDLRFFVYTILIKSANVLKNRDKMNSEKFKNLIHYICHKVRDPSKLGKTKLNKILYYSDFVYYLKTYKSITGEKYVKNEFGPVPANINKTLRVLVEEGKIAEREMAVIDFTRQEIVSIKQPDISEFKPEEIALIDEIIDVISNNHTAESISNLTHNDIWETARYGEEIPYYAILWQEVAPSEKSIQWANKSIAQKHSA